MSLTKNPMNPMMQNPTPVACAIATNSLRSGLVHFLTKCMESLANCFKGSTKTSLKPSFSAMDDDILNWLVFGKWILTVGARTMVVDLGIIGFSESSRNTIKGNQPAVCWIKDIVVEKGNQPKKENGVRISQHPDISDIHPRWNKETNDRPKGHSRTCRFGNQHVSKSMAMMYSSIGFHRFPITQAPRCSSR